jgi:2-oxoglutarate ferredoxin oxidoreductase subunit gamma
MVRYEMRLSGAGGQGLVLAGIIIADAAVMVEEFNVSQTQSYGPESRGGASRAEIVYGEDQIDFPKVMKPDLLVCLTQAAFDEYGDDLKQYGVMILDSSIDISEIDETLKETVYQLPIIETAVEKMNNKIYANMIVLGLISKILAKQIQAEFIEKSIIDHVPAETIDNNLEAFEIGREIKLKKRSYAHGKI